MRKSLMFVNLLGSLGAWFFPTGLLVAAEPSPGPSETLAFSGANDVEYFANLEDEIVLLGSSLLEEVHSATKTSQAGAQTPAVITVVTAEEIRARGYCNLADLLRTVPGFYDVYDGVWHNFGVRGINGGARAGGSGIKLMIDGLPVDYRPSTANFFGEELLPSLELVERVEIIRGPASALYGANAFLGVINVVTRTGKSLAGFHLVAEGSTARTHLGGGLAVAQGFAGENFDFLLAVGGYYRDRSGLRLPDSSPALADAASPLHERGSSRNDLSRPRSLFGKSVIKLWRGELSALVSVQNLDAGGELLDTGPMTHGTRVALLNQNYRLAYRIDPVEHMTLTVGAQYADASPTSHNRLDIGEPSYVLIPSAGAEAYGASVEAVVTAPSRVTLVFGADVVQEHQLLQTFDRLQTVDDLSAGRLAGSVSTGEGHGQSRILENEGAYAQALISWTRAWHTALNARIDYHSLSGWNPSARAGLVWAEPEGPLSFKLLYGSSFKAPSSEQLYTQPADFLDIQGNPKLEPQTAHTFELAGGWLLPGRRGEITVNLFATETLGRVEFLQRSLFLEAQNIADEWTAGGELDGRLALTRSLQVRLAGSVARTVAHTNRTLVLPTAQVTNSLFPLYQLHAGVDGALPFFGLRWSGELSYIGPRSASQSNSVIHGGPYELPGYFYGAASLSTTIKHLVAENETQLALRVVNLLNTQWSDSGFAGIDIPAQGTSVYLTIVQPLERPEGSLR